VASNVNAQAYFSINNLDDYVVQTQNISPVYVPNASITLGTPVNFSANIYSNLKISDFLVNNGTVLKVDIDNLNRVSKDINFLNYSLNASLAMVNFKTSKGSISFFSNLKSSLNWEFSDNLTNVFNVGLKDGVDFSEEKINFTSYSEIGIGITQKLFKDHLAIGVRVKLLNGIFHAESDKNASLSLDIDPATSYWNVQASNAILNTSGFGNDFNEMPFITKNKGVGFDFGTSIKINNRLSIEASVNDIGTISWTENTTTYSIEDTEGSQYRGVDLNENGSVLTEIENALKNVIGAKTIKKSFKTKLAKTMYVTAKQHITPKNLLIASFYKNYSSFKIDPLYSLGYNRILKNSSYGILAVKGGLNDIITFGANMAVRFANVQLYAATDNIINIFGKVEEVNSGGIQFGINLLFGNN
jgi:hypothetical protein